MEGEKLAIPNAGSEYLQAGVSVIRASHGDARTKEFLSGLKDNAGAQVYQKALKSWRPLRRDKPLPRYRQPRNHTDRHRPPEPTAPVAAFMPDQQESGTGAIYDVAGVGIINIYQASRMGPASC